MRRGFVAAALLGCLADVTVGAQDAAVPRSVEEAEAEGAKHPRLDATLSEGGPPEDAFGTSARRCVDVARHPMVRSGDFVAGPFDRPVMMPARAGLPNRKLWWRPRAIPELAPYWELTGSELSQALRDAPTRPVLTLRGVSLESPDVVAHFTFELVSRPVEMVRNPSTGRLQPAASQPANRPWFFPSEVRFPHRGKWMVIATTGANWGCFLVDWL